MPKSMPLEKKRIAQYSMLISNGSLIGLPLIEGAVRKHGCRVCEHLYDSNADSVVLLRGEIFQYGVEAGRRAVRDEEILFNPITIAMILGFLFNLARIPLPGGLDAVFSSLSGCMSPLALLLVGSTLLDRESTSMGIIEGYCADQSVPADHRAVLDLDRWCGAAFKHAAADCRRAGQRDAGRLHGHDLLPQV